jgi:hypothetical protein
MWKRENPQNAHIVVPGKCDDTADADLFAHLFDPLAVDADITGLDKLPCKERLFTSRMQWRKRSILTGPSGA